MDPKAKRIVLIVNTVGFAAYLAWLMQFNLGESLRTQGGILYYVPCIPFIFLYMLMLPPKAKSRPWWQSEEDYEQEQRAKQAAADAKAAQAPDAKPEKRA